jgi:hypothetical protein
MTKKLSILIMVMIFHIALKANYGFFGSAVYIEKNGTYEFYNCFGTNIGSQTFSGSLGTFVQNSGTLKLGGAEIKTWKDSWSNVCTPVFNYRIYSGTPTGNFIAPELPFYCNCSGGSFPCGGGSCGGNDQKWQKPGSTGSGLNIDLTTYTPGTYTIEVFYRVPGNQNGTTDCPDNVWDNNGGNPTNYTMSFTISANMPIDLVKFNAENINTGIKLSWLTSKEVNNDLYEIQRLIDGEGFKSIGEVKGSGTSFEQNQYVFLDNNPSNGINIYRLKQIDLDGSFNYSDIVSAKYYDNETPKLIITPTLATNDIVCELYNINYEGKIVIVNSLGRVIKQELAAKNVNKISIDISNLERGQYFISYISSEFKETHKFIKK